jgi:exonuclease SbcD
MAKLREVYPTALQLEKPGMLGSEERPVNSEKLKRGELDMFRDFFQQVQGQELSSDQDEAIVDIIAELRKEEMET